MLKVKVRGIFSTALTKILYDNGIHIAEPSRVIAKRLNLECEQSFANTLIIDRADRHGVNIIGPREHVEKILDIIWKRVPTAIVQNRITIPDKASIDEFYAIQTICRRIGVKLEKVSRYLTGESKILNVFFPLEAKIALDKIRKKVTPTIPFHHYYKSVRNETFFIDLMESSLPQGTLDRYSMNILKTFLAELFKGKEMLRMQEIILSGLKVSDELYNVSIDIKSLALNAEINGEIITLNLLGEKILRRINGVEVVEYTSMIEPLPDKIRYISFSRMIENSAWKDELKKLVEKRIISKYYLNKLRRIVSKYQDEF